MRRFTALAASFRRELMVLRKAALLIGNTLAPFAASFGRQFMVLGKAALLMRHARAAFAGDVSLLHDVHRSKGAIRPVVTREWKTKRG
jgi:hypothetical protein